MELTSLTKSAGKVGIATIISRIFGYIRDILLASLFGTSMFADVFFVAFRIPNTLRHLIGENAVNGAFIPVMSDYLQKHEEKEAWNMAASIGLSLICILVVFVGIGIIFAPFIMKIAAPGFAYTPGKIELAAKLLRIMFPYILFMGTAILVMSMLNCFKIFFIPALAPSILNICMITALIWFCHRMQEPVIGLAIAVVIGGIGQLAIQLPVLIKKGGRFFKDLKPRFNHPAAKTIGKLLIPIIIGSGVYHINILVDTLLASFSNIVGEGAVSALYFANRLIQLPLAVFGIGLGTVILPYMAGFASENNINKLRQTLSFSIRMIIFVTIPLSVLFMILRFQIIQLLFGWGNFQLDSIKATSFGLLCYSFGLVAYSTNQIMRRAFYAVKDTKTPLKIACLSMAINIMLNLALMWPLKLGGLALATSISAACSMAALFILFDKKIGRIDWAGIRDTLYRLLPASAVTAITCWLTLRWVICIEGNLLTMRLIQLFVPAFAGIISFLIVSYFLKLKELRHLFTLIGKIRQKPV
ncbi:murein biosynthesis integral membrane protein MurJ [bacterium]|nr:murein biosynthesis integral membrane protein MurJ [bacterium]